MLINALPANQRGSMGAVPTQMGEHANLVRRKQGASTGETAVAERLSLYLVVST